MNKILFVANVAKEHILKFHVPTIQMFKERGWIVDVACSGEDEIPICDHHFRMCWKRSPFNLRTLIGMRDLKNIINKNEYDIIYCHTPVGGLVTRLAAKKSRKNGTKVIYFAHGLHFYQGAPKLNWMIYYPIEKYLARYTDKFILSSQEDYQFVQNNFNKCRSYISFELGCNFDKFKLTNKESIRKIYRTELKIPQDALVMIYVAELIANKNQNMLLLALQKVRQYKPNTFLLLVGFEHDDGMYYNMAKKLGLINFVRFLGWRSDIAELFACSDICTASSIREGFGYNLVEAMACEVPVIATTNRGHITIIQNNENGFLVPLNDYQAMVERMLYLIENPYLQKKIVNNAKESIRKFTEEYVLEELYKYITE